MKLYVAAAVIALTATATLINACLLHTSTQHARPVNLVQLK
ncbi:hypothetical protein SAMN06265795_11584 [Noviherbaspirillum humi]|uniref:Uncharacterized protein n=1 Tax=Noviherbaspirillum humi TaxID=1688639 RepID=A0A239KAN2_9BURK|nr:hypothetical protein [Noviherbaspirillum humi]SNT15506.1 hypothetical protein SAMN06265795_11584 [Noviherbaspirillum humi]